MERRWFAAARTGNLIVGGNHPEKNPIRQLALMKQAFLDMQSCMLHWQELARDLRDMQGFEATNHRTRWDAEEDEALVQWRAEGRDLIEIARSLGRTPQSVATRLSELVGVPQGDVERLVHGRLNGVPVDGTFQGSIKAVS